MKNKEVEKYIHCTYLLSATTTYEHYTASRDRMQICLECTLIWRATTMKHYYHLHAFKAPYPLLFIRFIRVFASLNALTLTLTH